MRRGRLSSILLPSLSQRVKPRLFTTNSTPSQSLLYQSKNEVTFRVASWTLWAQVGASAYVAPAMILTSPLPELQKYALAGMISVGSVAAQYLYWHFVRRHVLRLYQMTDRPELRLATLGLFGQLKWQTVPKNEVVRRPSSSPYFINFSIPKTGRVYHLDKTAQIPNPQLLEQIFANRSL